MTVSPVYGRSRAGSGHHESSLKVAALGFRLGSGSTIDLSDLWVAPGAPDVRLFASPHPDGTIDTTSTELGLLPYGETVQRWPFPDTLAAEHARSVVIYCHVYSVHFGHAELQWLAQ